MIKGHLDTIVLAILDGRAAHGYAVIEEIRRRTRGAFDLPEGTVYPALHRLESAQLLASHWEVSASGRRRRVYSLTKQGMDALARRRNVWAEFSSAIGAVLKESYLCNIPA